MFYEFFKTLVMSLEFNYFIMCTLVLYSCPI